MFLVCLIGGFILISLASIAESLLGIFVLQAGIPPAKNPLDLLVRESPAYPVYSKQLDIAPIDGTNCTIVTLDGERYIGVRPFLHYVERNEQAYTFAFPGMKPFTLDCSPAYYPGAKLFRHQDTAYVLIRELRLAVRDEGGEIWFEPQPAEAGQ